MAIKGAGQFKRKADNHARITGHNTASMRHQWMCLTAQCHVNSTKKSR